MDVDAEVLERTSPGLERDDRAALHLVPHRERVGEVQHEPALVRGRVAPVWRLVELRFVHRAPFVYVYSNPVMADSLASDCCATTRRTVPERERMTMESVSAPPGE